jgi:hypothetical protein
MAKVASTQREGWTVVDQGRRRQYDLVGAHGNVFVCWWKREGVVS